MSNSLVWGVYERADAAGVVVVALRRLADGTFEVGCPPLADIAPLPVSVHKDRRAADRAAARLLYECAGSA
jgi:hypothetical protein